MAIASLSLSDSLFEFANGTQALNTDVDHWKASLTGFGLDYVAPDDLGPNGGMVWGMVNGVDPAARHIWTGGSAGEHYFSTEIRPVPEPTSLAALALCLAAMRRRR